MSAFDEGPFAVAVLDRRGSPVHEDGESTLDVSVQTNWESARHFACEIVNGVDLPEHWPAENSPHLSYPARALVRLHDEQIVVIAHKRACVAIPGKEEIEVAIADSNDNIDSNILDDDSQFVVDVLSTYGNTQANDVVPSDGMDTARRLATGIKTGTLRLVFHDDLEDLAARILKLEGVEHALICVVRTCDEVEWSVALGGDGWETCEQRRTLTEAMNDTIERGMEEGTAGLRNFIRRCHKLNLAMDAGYLLAGDAGININPDTWEALWVQITQES